ncbi:hypothetical protein CcCBS67573_g02802 [Chytriomyces confervae]|uniref:RBR-type E3 ubiquitin transferase n=1 Tax=Chytriomyces confervae TaxID=246404 RepID=A0A507FKT7_9FUNG|nr:E3 ubiquitin-protein ligase rnf14 [Chytriomyces hyalinus]TPX75936.1 hypothetical protein CcCBS67573_g02802 [Chytriomyces confervae]
MGGHSSREARVEENHLSGSESVSHSNLDESMSIDAQKFIHASLSEPECGIDIGDGSLTAEIVAYWAVVNTMISAEASDDSHVAGVGRCCPSRAGVAYDSGDVIQRFSPGPESELSCFECKICLDEGICISDAFTIFPCSHTICRTCAHDVIMSDVLSRNFPIYCPVCKAESSSSRFRANPEPVPALDLLDRQQTKLNLKDRVRAMRVQLIRRIKDAVARNRELQLNGEYDQNEEEEDSDSNEYIPTISIDLASTVLAQNEMDQLERLSLLKVIDGDARFQRCPNSSCEAVFYNDDPSLAKRVCIACKSVCCWKCRTDTAHDGFTCEQYQELNQRNGNDREQMRFEEILTQEKWKRCPKCTIATAKNEGCNKMSCEICKAYWCFCCGKQLSKKRPYLHYTRRFSKCYNKLFQD